MLYFNFIFFSIIAFVFDYSFLSIIGDSTRLKMIAIGALIFIVSNLWFYHTVELNSYKINSGLFFACLFILMILVYICVERSVSKGADGFNGETFIYFLLVQLLHAWTNAMLIKFHRETPYKVKINNDELIVTLVFSEYNIRCPRILRTDIDVNRRVSRYIILADDRNDKIKKIHLYDFEKKDVDDFLDELAKVCSEKVSAE